jgi:hypothetical protein
MMIECLKGNRDIGISKNKTYEVIDAFQMGKDFGYNVRIVIKINSWCRRTLYVPMVHKNRLSAPDGFNVNTGDPTRKARIKFVGDFTIR